MDNKLEYAAHIVGISASLIGMLIAMRTDSQWGWQMACLTWTSVSLINLIKLKDCEKLKK